MNISFVIQSILLGVGLAMDASAVSMTNGLNEPQMKVKKVILVAFMYAFFQALMPFIGYLCGSAFTNIIAKYVPWIALILLGFIGGKMLIEGIRNKKEAEDDKKLTLKTLLVQAIATSIDALSVGLIMIGYSRIELTTALLCVSITTFILSFVSVYIGKKFGSLLENKAAIIGGIILIGIGIEIFVSSFFK